MSTFQTIKVVRFGHVDPAGIAYFPRIYDFVHEVFEELWRAAEPAERDLYQGLVHVAVATYQDGRGNEVGRTRQLEKALRRLTPYAPAYEGVEIAELLDWCRASLAATHCDPGVPWK